jgi:hypothetical protein
MNYVLKWGSNTWIPALMSGGLLGILIIMFCWHIMGEAWYGTYFVPMLGYYVLISICQSHYFKSNPLPNYEGFWKQAASIGGAIVLFFLHRWIMGQLFGIPEKLVFPGQLTFIVLGFFFYGWDDFMFLGRLSGWLKVDALKALFWYLFIWVMWYILYATPAGIVAALGDFNKLNLDILLGISQWIIVMSLMIAITWKDFLATLQFPNDYVRGMVLLAFSVTMGVVIGLICLYIINLVKPDLSSSEKWHHILYMGTYPLIPLIVFGLYTNHFNHIKGAFIKALARTVFLIVLVAIEYFLFKKAISPALFGEHPWWHQQDLVFNFTIAIIILTHHWFNGRLGFLKEQSPGTT